MKILPVPLIREADAFTIANEPISDIDLMERAAGTCFEWLRERFTTDHPFKVFCGPGNNGGDGLAISRMLAGEGYRVEVFTLAPEQKMSESCRTNYQRMRACRHAGMQELTEGEAFPLLKPSDIVIDVIFGNGLTRPPSGLSAAVIDHINSSRTTVVSIDVASGMYTDGHTPNRPDHPVIRASFTLTFAPPKLAFLFSENDSFVGDWHLLDIGLDAKFLENAETKNFLLTRDDVAPLLRKRNKFDHKGRFGHALLLAGSAGKMGAAVLAARACLRSGAGLTTVHVPDSGVAILQTAVPEAMLSIDPSEKILTALPSLQGYSAVSAGPGLGTSPETANAIKRLIQESGRPIIFDADAINILSENKTWLGFLPEGCIFTPHPKEFERLVGKSQDDFERNRLQREFSFRFRCYMVLKGAHTAITTPDGRCYFNTTGNPGMATGGSGDVLTGILTGLLA
ncbi:MAG TPA: NAD(P)H-hydrate dehydratase, partial [Bacteroidales bacterium]|nr:NAD(P)H-hydrate dehydratase [Bacteroidales bacterium]